MRVISTGTKTLLDVFQGNQEYGLTPTDSYNRALDKGRADGSEPILFTRISYGRCPSGADANSPIFRPAEGIGFSIRSSEIGRFRARWWQAPDMCTHRHTAASTQRAREFPAAAR